MAVAQQAFTSRLIKRYKLAAICPIQLTDVLCLSQPVFLVCFLLKSLHLKTSWCHIVNCDFHWTHMKRSVGAEALPPHSAHGGMCLTISPRLHTRTIHAYANLSVNLPSPPGPKRHLHLLLKP
jgi:hypothetical protein